MTTIQYLERRGKPRLAYVRTLATERGAALPPIVFLGGYRSDMNGTKATFLEEKCKARGQAFLRFDYSGHGCSGGDFADGTIGSWKDDALAVLNVLTEGPVILVGSSMGGWIAFLLALARPGKIKGLVGIAAAPDFTEEIYRRLNDAQRKQFVETGRVEEPSDYSPEPYVFTRGFFEEAKAHLILNKTHDVDFPIRLVQGKRDTDVPWKTTLAIARAFHLSENAITFIEDGDHRLSRPQDLDIIDREIRVICGI